MLCVPRWMAATRHVCKMELFLEHCNYLDWMPPDMPPMTHGGDDSCTSYTRRESVVYNVILVDVVLKSVVWRQSGL